jgi:hypothetical protein
MNKGDFYGKLLLLLWWAGHTVITRAEIFSQSAADPTCTVRNVILFKFKRINNCYELVTLINHVYTHINLFFATFSSESFDSVELSI